MNKLGRYFIKMSSSEAKEEAITFSQMRELMHQMTANIRMDIMDELNMKLKKFEEVWQSPLAETVSLPTSPAPEAPAELKSTGPTSPVISTTRPSFRRW